MSVARDLMWTAEVTYAMALAYSGDRHSAMEQAISASLEQHERNVLARIANMAETLAAGEAQDESFQVAENTLRWFADKIREELPVNDEYQPKFDDIVEITVTGQVIMPPPGSSDEEPEWAIIDDATGEVYEFFPDERPRVRVLERGEDIARRAA